MRLEITRRADLATRAMGLLAGGGQRKAADLAAELSASAGFVAQAMTPLVNKGWVRSDPGPTGGYRLVVDPGAVSVLDVIEAVEGTTDSGECVLENRPCTGAEQCALHIPWAQARAVLLTQLAQTPVTAGAAS